MATRYGVHLGKSHKPPWNRGMWWGWRGRGEWEKYLGGRIYTGLTDCMLRLGGMKKRGETEIRSHKKIAKKQEMMVDSRRDGWHGLLIYNNCRGKMDVSFKVKNSQGTGREKQARKTLTSYAHCQACANKWETVANSQSSRKHTLMYQTFTGYVLRVP